MQNWKNKFYEKYSSYMGRTFESTPYAEYGPYGKYIIDKTFPKEKKINILDLACGIGGYLKVIKDSGYNSIIGVDASVEEVNYAQKQGLTQVHLGDLFDFIKKADSNYYDIVLALDIIEHLEKDEVLNFVEGVFNILKPGGKLIIHTPNAEGIFGSKVRYSDFTHEAAFTKNSISQICRYAGFKSIQCYEDKPLIYSIPSLLRRIVWTLFTLQFRLINAAETGSFNVILTQNFLSVAQK